MAVSLWVHKNIMKLSKHHEVELKGCEEEALSLFLKIDERRDKNKEVYTSGTKTPKWKGVKDFKNLCVFHVKFGDTGGRYLVVINENKHHLMDIGV